MQIIQLIPTIAYGDAVGNDTIALRRVIEEMGYRTGIYAESVVPPLDETTAQRIQALPQLNENDIAILHLSTGAQLNFDFAKLPCKKIVMYHNITPPHYFEDNDPFIRDINAWAIEGAKYLSDKVDYCIADSEYNKQDLIEMGYTCPIDVLPILIPLDDYRKKPNRQIVSKYKDGHTNFVFTGRIAPNKKQQDIIQAFCCYKKYCDAEARLFLVGSYKEENMYYRKLRQYTLELGVSDVYFTNHIKFDEILAYYAIADVFLCMSEHEGFCVPLVEAMSFDIPILAYSSSAIPYTLGGSGVLLEDKQPILVAKMMERLVNDQELRDKVLKNQAIRLKDFEYEVIRKQFVDYMKQFIQGVEE